MKIIILILTFVIGFLTGVLGIKSCKGCSVKEATIICRDSVTKFLKEVFRTLLEPSPKPEPFYPVLVGWDGCCRILPQLVDSEFSAVRANFLSCYCTSFTLTEDNLFVIYRFDIMRKPGGMDDDVLGQLVQKQAEEILANTMRRYDCYLPVEPLTFTEIFPHSLNVAFARNEAGIRELDAQKRKMQKRKALAKRPENKIMREDWKDDDDKK